jgi:hypothetical protein
MCLGWGSDWSFVLRRSLSLLHEAFTTEQTAQEAGNGKGVSGFLFFSSFFLFQLPALLSYCFLVGSWDFTGRVTWVGCQTCTLGPGWIIKFTVEQQRQEEMCWVKGEGAGCLGIIPSRRRIATQIYESSLNRRLLMNFQSLSLSLSLSLLVLCCLW